MTGAAGHGAVLRHLLILEQHVAQPDFPCRFRWETGTLAIWDNRVTQHYALDDYREHERLMYRVTVSADTAAP